MSSLLLGTILNEIAALTITIVAVVANFEKIQNFVCRTVHQINHEIILVDPETYEHCYDFMPQIEMTTRIGRAYKMARNQPVLLVARLKGYHKLITYRMMNDNAVGPKDILIGSRLYYALIKRIECKRSKD